MHAVVARSTFGSKKCQSTPFSEHFWKLRCGKSARRCGAKHIWKSKVAKHVSFGRLLDDAVSKKVHAVVARSTFCEKNCSNYRMLAATFGCSDLEKQRTPLWREAHFEVKSVKNTRCS